MPCGMGLGMVCLVPEEGEGITLAEEQHELQQVPAGPFAPFLPLSFNSATRHAFVFL